ncbi:MAG: ATP-binding cassette domain-containing protein, partial [Gemmatimonadota bacterium]
MTRAPALELRGIVRQFGMVRALDGVDFAVEPGEIHTLLGENGAGKSTLMHVAYGMLRPDAGAIVVDGTVRTIASPRDARRLGLGMVHQHFTSIPSFTVAENIALAAGWAVAPAGLRERVRQLVADAGLPLDPDARAESLTVALKQRLEIVKALAADARVLLLDEPTAVLAPAEAEELLRMVRAFVARGNAAVLITHKLDEALSAADRVTVLRAGRVVHTGPAGEATSGSLARAMIGDGTVSIGD